MQPTTFMQKLRERGGDLSVVDGALWYRGRREAMTPAVRAYIESHKDRLIEHLQPEERPCEIGGCSYPARYPLNSPRYCARKHSRLGIAKDADELLAPYASLIARAERGELVGMVGFQGGDLDANTAVLRAREWIITTKPLEDSDPYASDALADWLNVLETLNAACSENRA